jgi:hypothetical protein
MAALATRCGRRRPSFSVPRLRRGVHRPAAAALRSGADVRVVGSVALPRLRWRSSFRPGGAWSEAEGMHARLRGRLSIRGRILAFTL